MKKIFLSTSFFLLSILVFGQFDYGLFLQVDSLAKIDQKWRGLFRQIGNKEIDTISQVVVSKKIQITDSLNFTRIKMMFDKYGYLGYNKVGSEGSHNFWLLVQHADNYSAFQDSVLTKMKVEADSGNTSLSDYAYLVDRVKVNTKQLQVYGTQMTLNSEGNSYIPKPTIDPEKLNDRRKQAGLPPIEIYINQMNECYYGDLNKK